MELVPKERQCGAKLRNKSKYCKNPAGFKTPHLGKGKCFLHGGLSPVKHGRYSMVLSETLREMIHQFEEDESPLDIRSEIAAGRALFVDYLNRYQTHTDALLAWHESFKRREHFTEQRRLALSRVLDELEDRLQERGDETPELEEALETMREFLRDQDQLEDAKPRTILDISHARLLLENITAMVERVEKSRAANAVSRADLIRIMAEMGRVVESVVPDPEHRKEIQEKWLTIRIA